MIDIENVTWLCSAEESYCTSWLWRDRCTATSASGWQGRAAETILL